MRRKGAAGASLVVSLLFGAMGSTQGVAAQVPDVEVLFEAEFPAGIAFGFGKMFFTERPGRIRVVEGGRLLPQPLATIPTTTSGESGLLGIAVPPDPADRAVYVFASAPDGSVNQVWRAPIDGDEPTLVVGDMPSGGYHNGGGLAFDDDGMLLVSNGEGHAAERSQDPYVFGGKIYRYTVLGEIPDDNPWPDSPAMSVGHRNPFGLAVDPETGVAWTTENGPSNFDEINRSEPGSNQGWPLLSGPGCATQPDIDLCADPVLSYEDVIVPTGISFAPPDAPRRYAGHLFFGAYGEPGIHEVVLDDARREAVSDELFVDEDEGVVAVAWGPRGLYYSTSTAVKLVPLGTEGGSEGEAPKPLPSGAPEGAEEETETTGFVLVIVVLLVLFAASRRKLFR
jgi:glucose/arabinose dehydrogenase